jgi:hypothetical protein
MGSQSLHIGLARWSLSRALMREQLVPLVAALAAACGTTPALITPTPTDTAPASAEPRPSLARAEQLAGSMRLTCRITATRHVECWGSMFPSGAPRVIAHIEDAAQIVMEELEPLACVRSTAGAVACFDDEHAPVDIDIDDAVELALQDGELCAVRRGGTIACWGGTWGTHVRSWRPDGGLDAPWDELTEREGASGIVALRGAPGSRLTRAAPCWCAIRREGSLACWGQCEGVPRPNGWEDPDGSFPVFDVPSITDARDVLLGAESICVLRASGGVVCAGAGYGDDGVVVVRPGEPTVPPGFTAIAGTEEVSRLEATRSQHGAASCGVTQDHRRLCWEILDGRVAEDDEEDYLDEEQEHEGPAERSPPAWDELDAPEGVLEEAIEWVALAGVEEIVAAHRHACMRRAGGEVSCWGDLRLVGRGRFDASHVPVAIEGVRDVVELVASATSTCARSADGTVSCWGGFAGPTARRIEELSGAATIVGRESTMCTIDARGAMRCRGELTRPFEEDAPPLALPNARRVTAASIGSSRACWVAAGRGQCVERDLERRRLRSVPLALRDVAEMAGGTIGCARATNGDVSCWSSVEEEGREHELDVRQVLTGATRIAVRRPHVCAIVEGGRVRCANVRGGQERMLFDLERVIDLAISEYHGCAIVEGGAVWCWGDGTSGQNGRPFEQGDPVRVPIDDATQVVVGDAYSCALRADRTVACWGSDHYGQLGRGERPTTTAEPLVVPEAQ